MGTLGQASRKSQSHFGIDKLHGLLVPWAQGPLGPWALGPHGPLGPWARGPMGPCTHGPIGMVPMGPSAVQLGLYEVDLYVKSI